MQIPFSHVALVAISAANGFPLDSLRTTTYPKPVVTETDPDGVIGAGECNVQNVEGVYIPVATVGTKDGKTGNAQVRVTATQGGVPLGPVVFDVEVIDAAATPIPSSAESAGGLTVAILGLRRKPNYPA